MFNIEEELNKLPNKPGVYIMKNKDDKIIYIGKAISLKNRVRQYFRKSNKTIRIQNMVSLIHHFEYIVTDTEAEALILECNLIKKNMPKFNVLLKDDKTYPYIKINIKSEYPDLYVTRRILNDGAKYFGPYANAGAAKEMVDFIKSKFKIRQCKKFKYKDRPCLNYHIKKCLAPCMNLVEKEEYMEQINQIIEILEGKTEKIKKQLKQELSKMVEEQKYEKAANIRDKIIAIERISEKQKVSNITENDIDVIGIAKSDIEVCIEIFFVRKSKMVGREHYFFTGLNDEKDSEILSDFIKQYYIEDSILPNKIMLKKEPIDKQLIEILLTEKAERRVEIKTPQKGEKLRLVEMAEKNARITLENRGKEKYNVLIELRKVLGLKNIPKRIEGYDVSNILGTNMVAGMCVIENGVIKKSLSRRFKIKAVYNQDDPRCIKEVIIRRLRHFIENRIDKTKLSNNIQKENKNIKNDNFGELPDVIFVDGGITQIKAANQAVQEIYEEYKDEIKKDNYRLNLLDLNIPVFGMVKDDKHKTRSLLDDKNNELELSEKLLNLITRFQNTIHDNAIGYHRKLRDSEMVKSILDEIPGIGVVKKTLLLKKFGSVENIRKADIEEITKIKGINIELAKRLKNKLNKKDII